jgi:magnesium-transporting ATPase (P-type)
LKKLEIKVWMLTGDKLETAINIAKSCNLIQPGFQVLECAEKTMSEVKETLVMHRKRYDYFTQNKIPKAFVVEGESLGLNSKKY